MIPSHIIQQKADRKRYCKSAATNMHAPCNQKPTVTYARSAWVSARQQCWQNAEVEKGLSGILAVLAVSYLILSGKLNSQNKQEIGKEQGNGKVEMNEVVNFLKHFLPATQQMWYITLLFCRIVSPDG